MRYQENKRQDQGTPQREERRLPWRTRPSRAQRNPGAALWMKNGLHRLACLNAKIKPFFPSCYWSEYCIYSTVDLTNLKAGLLFGKTTEKKRREIQEMWALIIVALVRVLIFRRAGAVESVDEMGILSETLKLLRDKCSSKLMSKEEK